MRRVLLLVVIVGAGGTMLGSTASAARPRTPLRSTNWVLTDRVPLGTPLGDVAVNAVFDAKTVQGDSGCNGYQHSYTTRGSRMTIADDLPAAARLTLPLNTKLAGHVGPPSGYADRRG